MTTQAKTFDFQVVSPEKILFQGTTSMTVLPATSGSLGVLANHAPTVITLARGIIDVYNDNEITHRLFVGGGFANITESGCLVMADDAIAVEDLDEAEILQHISNIETAIERTIIEEEKTALRNDASIAKTKIDLIQNLMKQS